MLLRGILLTAFCMPLFGMDCDAPLVCADPVDGSEFGFTLNVPAGFTCTSSLPVQNEVLRGFVTLEDAVRGIQLLVLVGSASDTNTGEFTDDGVECNDLGDFDNAAGITFERCRFDEPERVSYAATTGLPTANNLLLVSIVADEDDASLEGVLNAILEGIAFTQ